MRRWPAALVACALLVHAPSAARAQETAQCERELSPIVTAMDDDARHARVWYWSWMAAGVALIGAQTALSIATTGDMRNDSIVGAGASVFIPAFLLIHPPDVMSDAPRLDERLALTSVQGRFGDPCLALPRARELLRRDADDEGFAKSWFAHTFVVAGNIALGLILGLGFGDWLGFAKQAVGGSLVGELQIWTAPGGSLSARGLGLGGSF